MANNMPIPRTTSLGGLDKPFFQPPYLVANPVLSTGQESTGHCKTLSILQQANNCNSTGASIPGNIENVPLFLHKLGNLRKQQDQLKQRHQCASLGPGQKTQEIMSQDTQEIKLSPLQYSETLSHIQSMMIQRHFTRQYTTLQVVQSHKHQVPRREITGALSNRGTHESKAHNVSVAEQAPMPSFSAEGRKETNWDKGDFLPCSFFEKGSDPIHHALSKNINMLAYAPINRSIIRNNQFCFESNTDHMVESKFDRLLRAAVTIEDENKQDMDLLESQESDTDFLIKDSNLQFRNARSSPSASASSNMSLNIGQELLPVSVQSESVVLAKKQQYKRRKSHEMIKIHSCNTRLNKKAKKSSEKYKRKLNTCSCEPKIAQTFPQKLMDVLMNGPEDDNVVAWLPDGKSFVILDPDEFVSKRLPYAFKKCKYSSFTQKLNRWGFVRMASGTGVGCFHHQLFQKGRIDLCLMMLPVRGKDKAQIKKAEERLERKRKFFTENKEEVIRISLSESSEPRDAEKPPSLVGLDKFVKKSLGSHHTIEATIKS
uniref:HSF-type DNA-binding domain-containing protein n=1 Tax=Ditylum brightwellii TaxID=49249 RepID=A0A7S4SHJ4_9STRA